MYYEIEDELGNVSTIQLKERISESVESLREGDIAPLFYLKSDEGFPVTSLTGFSVTGDTRDLMDLIQSKPLVITFYCTCWGSYAPKYLNFLQEITPQVEALGGQVLVLTTESPKQIERLSKKLDAELTFFHDKDHNVARSYGVFSETSPIWDRIAGISEEVFTPALFVVGGDRKVLYAFVDENFDGQPQVKRVLEKIYNFKNKK
ncbi:hypothetical protein DYBT9275_03463 [Dyadobacter sp. CECT 9275]|uniref:Thioredoxin domain-containing protein n=1 Tax=Dyadobacter helix TaxID=2822344 RepID=A0A916JEY3_9BACT|nr:redoxin domain-containing protein [Dyadobacter sp. CECT 9275]CAG5004860.1 hypothetical protein DYBT9275_03463 [Dyadobacter sp. CECT 9275]